jgi:hypothetical protein
MSGIDGGLGVAGSSTFLYQPCSRIVSPYAQPIDFSHYDYPGTYSSQYFHHCGTPGDDIQDFSNRFQVQNCELANLAECVTLVYIPE